MSERTVPKEFNDANIRAARKFKAERDAAVKALAAMLDTFGGYSGVPACDEAIGVMQLLGCDRWSMQSQMDRAAARIPQETSHE